MKKNEVKMERVAAVRKLASFSLYPYPYPHMTAGVGERREHMQNFTYCVPTEILFGKDTH